MKRMNLPIGSCKVVMLGALLMCPAGAASPARSQAVADDPARAAVETSERAAIQYRLAQGAMSRFRFAAAEGPVLDTMLTARDGSAIALASLRGKTVLVNVWASWCPACRKEMASLAQIASNLSREGLAVLALNIDHKAASADRFLDGLGRRDLAAYFDPEARAAKELGARGVPVSILIDSNGHEIGRIEGAVDWTSEEAVLLLRAALSGRLGSTGAGQPPH
jgi:thiol-disulfide isomerase/thioredoxin